tara:strand:- start:2601 stop:3647 length:1047 start_codon:yes stop_codon:yes gene_type:complete
MNTEILNFNLTNSKNDSNKAKKINFLKVKTNRIYLPWVEKYRPSVLSDVILDDITRHKMEKFLSNHEISNMIITGHPGTGKTSTILCLARQIYESSFNEAVIEYNASDNRGLETINNSIIHFCKKKVTTQNNLPKLVILDEADNITKKAQNTLCNLMEIYDNTTKFVLTCNDYNKLVEGIQTRCLIIRYNSLSNDVIKNRLISICDKENIKYDDKGLDAIIFISQGDIRLAINCLESTYFGFNKITYDNVYRICEKPPQIQIISLINMCLSGSLKEAVSTVLKLKGIGYCNNDILLTIIHVLKDMPLDERLRIEMLEYTSKAYMITNDGVDTDLQLLRCICDFYELSK